MKTKICTKCKINKSLKDYYKDIKHKDGRRSACKSCTIAEQKKYDTKNRLKISEYRKGYGKEYRIKNKQKISVYHKGYGKKYRFKNKQKISEYQKEYMKKYWTENKQKISGYQKKYYIENKPRILEACKEYSKSDKGKLVKAKYAKSDKGKLTIAEYWKSDKGKAANARGRHNRGINVANTKNTLTDKEFNYILFLQQYKCICCGEYFDKVKPQRDHIMPVKLGGDFIKENVQVLCKSCDSTKGARYIDYRTNYHKEMIETI